MRKTTIAMDRRFSEGSGIVKDKCTKPQANGKCLYALINDAGLMKKKNHRPYIFVRSFQLDTSIFRLVCSLIGIIFTACGFVLLMGNTQ